LSETQCSNALASITKLESGRHIDLNDRQSENDFASIRVSFDSDSKVTDRRSQHRYKDSAPTISTEAGTQIEFKRIQRENDLAPIRVSLAGTRKSLTKALGTNNLNRCRNTD
jgi:hypothetical protein